MMKYLSEKLNDVISTAKTHQSRIEDAHKIISSWGVINKDVYYSLTKEHIAITDQYLYRFAKLQDLIGDKLFKLVLDYVGENTEKLAFIDVLNKLEKLGVIASASIWLELRIDRNNIAHDYIKNIEEILEDLMVLINKKDMLISQLNACTDYLNSKGYMANK